MNRKTLEDFLQKSRDPDLVIEDKLSFSLSLRHEVLEVALRALEEATRLGQNAALELRGVHYMVHIEGPATLPTPFLMAPQGKRAVYMPGSDPELIRKILSGTDRIVDQTTFEAQFTGKHPAQPSVLDYMRDEVDLILATFQKHGYHITELQAILFWEAYSNSMCASWMGENQAIIEREVIRFLEDPPKWWQVHPSPPG